MHMNAVPRTRYHVPQETVIVKRPRRVRGVGPTLLRKRNTVPDDQKRSGSLVAEHPTDPATSSEFAGLLTKIAPNTQSLWVTTSGNEVSLITSKLEVAKDMSPRALINFGASNNFVRRQSLDNSKLKCIEREIPRTRMTVRLATGASATVMKRVVGIFFTLKEVQYDNNFIFLDLDDKLILSLVYRGSEGTSHKSADIDEVPICPPLVH